VEKQIKKHSCILAYLTGVHGQSSMGGRWYIYAKSNPMARNVQECGKIMWGKVIRIVGEKGLIKQIEKHACILAYLQRMQGQTSMGDKWFKFSILNPMMLNYHKCANLLWGIVIRI